YIRESNYRNGLIADKTQPSSPASIAAVGMALASIPVFAERHLLPRSLLAKRVLNRFRFFRDSPQGPEPDATGYKGFYYHFLDMNTGRREWKCELSTIDSAFLFAGMLTCGTYFDRDTADEAEIRTLVAELYGRADWNWVRDAYMREHGSDYFTNSRLATYMQQEYAIRNPLEFVGYGEHCWGFTACDGPGWERRIVNGIERQFFDYLARGAPYGPDDGTVAPWAVVASLPFAPEIVIPTVRPLAALARGMTKP